MDMPTPLANRWSGLAAAPRGPCPFPSAPATSPGLPVEIAQVLANDAVDPAVEHPGDDRHPAPTL
jgi:hypothetical protein